MTEIIISLSLLLLVTVSDLRLMTYYLQVEKASYLRTIASLKSLSARTNSEILKPPPVSSEIVRAITLIGGP
jgi:hypothetical protein